jgi:hypothetical protein
LRSGSRSFRALRGCRRRETAGGIRGSCRFSRERWFPPLPADLLPGGLGFPAFERGSGSAARWTIVSLRTAIGLCPCPCCRCRETTGRRKCRPCGGWSFSLAWLLPLSARWPGCGSLSARGPRTLPGCRRPELLVLAIMRHRQGPSRRGKGNRGWRRQRYLHRTGYSGYSEFGQAAFEEVIRLRVHRERMDLSRGG